MWLVDPNYLLFFLQDTVVDLGAGPCHTAHQINKVDHTTLGDKVFSLENDHDHGFGQ